MHGPTSSCGGNSATLPSVAVSNRSPSSTRVSLSALPTSSAVPSSGHSTPPNCMPTRAHNGLQTRPSGPADVAADTLCVCPVAFGPWICRHCNNNNTHIMLKYPIAMLAGVTAPSKAACTPHVCQVILCFIFAKLKYQCASIRGRCQCGSGNRTTPCCMAKIFGDQTFADVTCARMSNIKQKHVNPRTPMSWSLNAESRSPSCTAHNWPDPTETPKQCQILGIDIRQRVEQFTSILCYPVLTLKCKIHMA